MSSILNPKNNIKIVLLDDNLAIRFALQNVLDTFSDNIDFKIYTASEGVEGLGLIYVANPDIIIVDSTLPKYSGREILDFLESNHKVKTTKFILVLHHGSRKLTDISQTYKVLNKNSEDFIDQFRNEIFQYLKAFHISHFDTQKKGNTFINKIRNHIIDFGNFVNGSLVRWGSLSDFFMSKLHQPGAINTVYFVPWIASQVVLSFIFSLTLIYKHKDYDSNIVQSKADIRQYRVRTYPTLVTILSTLIFLIIQFVLFITGGIIIFGSFNLKSVFADEVTKVQTSFTKVIGNIRDDLKIHNL